MHTRGNAQGAGGAGAAKRLTLVGASADALASLSPQANDTAFRVRNEAAPAPATKKRSAEFTGFAQKKQKGAPTAVSPQLQVGYPCVLKTIRPAMV
jgi:hypothetical protein